MFVHKLLQGIGAEKYLPFALARLRALERIFGAQGYFTQKFETEGYKISVRQIPPFQYVDITGGAGPQFEWFASDHVDGYFYATPGYRYWELPAGVAVLGFGYVQGHGLRITLQEVKEKEKTKVKVKKPNPLYSHTFPPEGDPPKWAYKDTFDVYVPLGTRTKDFFKAWNSWQMQYIVEYQWFPNNKPDQMLTTCWGTAFGRLSLAGWGDYYWSDIIGGFFPAYDVVIDLAPTLHDTAGNVQGVLGPYMGTDNSWYRRGAMQEVKHETWGKRKYFILGDNKGRFHVYPVKPYWTDPYYYKHLVNIYGLGSSCSTTLQFKTVTPQYPPWVSMSPPEKLDVLLWWNWTFNKDATKAATIALHDQVRKGYYFYTSPGMFDDIQSQMSTTIFRAYLDRDFSDDPKYPARFGTSKKGKSPRVLTPGLVEIAIKIELTGDKEMDFNVSVEVLQSDYFGDSGRYYIDAAYLYDDERLSKQGLHEDLLVTSEIQNYTEDGNWFVRYIATQEGDDLDNPPFHYHFETNLDLDPEADPPYYYIRRSDPAMYTEGLDAVGVDVTSVYVIRRQDTKAEIKRHMLGHKTVISDWEYPESNPLMFSGPTGRPSGGERDITGIWMHGHFFRSNEHFERHGPGTGPDRGTYGYGGILKADLRSMSYVVFHVNSTIRGYRLPNTDDKEIKWFATGDTKRFQDDVYIFGEYNSTKAFDLVEAYPGYYRYYGWVDVSYAELPPSEYYSFPEPSPEKRITLDKTATMVYGSVNMNFMLMSGYNPIITHPRGHYSITDDIDEISFRTENKDGTFTDTKTTHAEMFNKAFMQNRDQTYYNGQNCAGPESGAFRLSGLWLPYKEDRKKKEDK